MFKWLFKKKGCAKHMNNKLEVIGIDHGWSMMKTISQVFVTGVKEITTTPTLFGDVLEYEGKFYKVGTVRQEVIHVTFMLDEFANVALPDDYCSLLSTMRSREISSIIIIQNFAQLKAISKILGKPFQATAILSFILEAMSRVHTSMSRSFWAKGRLIRSQAGRQRADREALQETMMY